MKTILSIALWLSLPIIYAQNYDPDVVVETYAGSKFLGVLDGIGTQTMFNPPASLVVDPTGTLFVSDDSQLIRRITADRTVTTLTAPGTFSALIVGDSGLIFTPGGTAIEEFAPPNHIIAGAYGESKFLDSVNPLQAQFTGIYCAVRAWGGLLVSDSQRIRMVNDSVVTTIIGYGGPGTEDGIGIFSSVLQPYHMALSKDGAVYIIDAGQLRVITPDFRIQTLSSNSDFAGFVDGPLSEARFGFKGLTGVACDSDGNVFLSDSDNNAIRRLSPSGVVTTVAGIRGGGFSDGVGAEARFRDPAGLAVGIDGAIYVADRNNYRIRRITLHLPPPERQPLTAVAFPGILLRGPIGRSYLIESSNSAEGSWAAIDQVILTKNPQAWVDTRPLISAFYRTREIP